MVETQKSEPQSAVFLSYSRKDLDFARRLAGALEARGYVAVFDQSERPLDDPDLHLSAQDEWWQSLRRMIASSDEMVFIVTPDSASSPICEDEIAHAKALGKRVIPVLRRQIDFSKAPERLRSLNIKIDFRDDDERHFSHAFSGLADELALDIDWHRQGVRLTRAANQWDSDNRPDAQLLRAGAIKEAETWLARSPAGESQVGPMVRAFLDASRTYESTVRDERRRTVGRAFVSPVEQAASIGQDDRALRLATAGTLLSDDPRFTLVPELWRAVAASALSGRPIAAFHASETATVSPDGSLAVIASEEGTIDVHNLDAGNRHRVRLSGHKARISSLAVAIDNTIVVSASDDGTVRTWEAPTGRLLTTLAHDFAVGAIRILAISPDRARIVTTCVDPRADVPAFVWDTLSGRLVATLRGHSDLITAASFDSTSRRIVTASQDKTARTWRSEDGKLLAVLRGHQRSLTSVLFCPKDTHIVTASVDQTARIWNPTTGAQTACLKGHDGPVGAAAFDHTGARVVTASADKTARLWDARTGRLLAQFRGHEEGVTSTAFSNDGARVVTGSHDRTVRIWDVVTSKEICRVACSHSVREAKFSLDGTRICGISRPARTLKSPDGTRITRTQSAHVQFWDAATSFQFLSLVGHRGPVQSIAFSPDSKLILTASDDGTARLWNAETGVAIRILRGHRAPLRAAAFGPDGLRVVTASGHYSQSDDNTARIWDASNGAELATLTGHGKVIWSAAFSPNGTHVVTTSGDGTARIWDATSGKQLAVLDVKDVDCHFAAFTGDGERIIVATKAEFLCWDARSYVPLDSANSSMGQAPLAIFAPNGIVEWLTGDDGYTRKLIRDDGLTVADEGCGLLDTRTGATIMRFATHRSAGAISPNGLRAATAGADGRVMVWDSSRAALLGLGPGVILCGAISRGVGSQLPEQTDDLLMRDTPEDLYAALSTLLEQDDAVQLAAMGVRARLHPNCYLSPTQLEGLFDRTSRRRREGTKGGSHRNKGTLSFWSSLWLVLAFALVVSAVFALLISMA